MDIAALSTDLLVAFPRSWEAAQAAAQTLLDTPWAGTFALIVIVYLTIRVIASIYSGDKQGAELGPIAIRPHPSARYGRNTIGMPHAPMPMARDGVAARCKIFSVYNDARGRRRKHLVHAVRDA
jgi:hypothetical protein